MPNLKLKAAAWGDFQDGVVHTSQDLLSGGWGGLGLAVIPGGGSAVRKNAAY